MKIIITATSVLIATTILLTANIYLPKIPLNLHKNEFVNGLFKYQLLVTIVAFVVFFLTIKITPPSKLLLQFGNLKTIAVKDKWLGINGKSTWKRNSIQLLIFISAATGIFMFLGVKYTDSLSNFKWWFIPIVLLISLTNSFGEEMIYRFAINGNLINNTPKITVIVISAVLFGLPHYMGFPSGIIGIIMAGFLGYILSKITYETQGIGIAWTIHFIQDIIIFTALFMINIKS